MVAWIDDAKLRMPSPGEKKDSQRDGVEECDAAQVDFGRLAVELVEPCFQRRRRTQVASRLARASREAAPTA